MRPKAYPFRLIAAVAAAFAVTACGDLATEPAGSDASDEQRLHLDVADVSTAQPLVCPTQETASGQALIGPEGGSLGVRGSSITVPPGAVPEPTLFEIVVPASQFMEIEIHPVGGDNYVFQQPATITINFARCSSDAIPATATLTGAYIDSATQQVLELMGGTIDRTGHKLSFVTSHLSGYIVAY